MDKQLKHCAEDTLLQHVLGTLDADLITEVEQHLLGCSQCSAQFSEIKADLASIESLNLSVETPEISYPSSKQGELPVYLKAAALIILGFGLGMVTQSRTSSKDFTLYSQAPAHSAVSFQSIDSGTCVSENLSAGTP